MPQAGQVTQNTSQVPWDARTFEIATGYKPEDDDLDRVNCEKAGEICHQGCGVCVAHGLPVFLCRTCFPLAVMGILLR